MTARVETMLERWKNHEGKEIDLFEEFRLLTSEVVSRTAFGSSYLEEKNVVEMLMKLYLLIFKNLFKLRFPGISKLIKTNDEVESKKLRKGIREGIIDIVKKREGKAIMIGETDSFGSDFLGLLLKAHHDSNEKQRISMDDLVEECKTFYFAGQETTNTLLARTVFLLTLHTDWQEESKKGDRANIWQTPNSEGLAKLKTMGMIINESLRLYPPIVSIAMKVVREVRLGKLVVPANVEIFIQVQQFTMSLSSGEKTCTFSNRSRFSEGIAKATKNRIAAFLPFGMGTRNCVRLDYATTEAKTVLSIILQRYSFTLSPAYVHNPLQYITVRPQHGVQILHSLTCI